MVEFLKGLVNRLSSHERRILEELHGLEDHAMSSLECATASLRVSPISQSSISVNDSFRCTEDFATMLMEATEGSSSALTKLRISVKVVDTVSELYNLGSRILGSYGDGDSDRGAEEVTGFIAAVEKAKREGYWEEVCRVISCGHINEVLGALRGFVIDQLRAQQPSDRSKLFTRLAVTLQASAEAYESYLKTVREQTQYIHSSSPRDGGECLMIEKIIKNASHLLLSQAQAVHCELGSVDYIRICREIHTATSAEACFVLGSFFQSTFGLFLNDTEGDVDDLLFQIEGGMDDPHLLSQYVSDPKMLDRALDDIAAISSLWNDYERSLRDILAPVYRTLLNQPGVGDEFSTDPLGENSRATRVLQSLLALYVRLEHASVTRGLSHAISYDSIYVASPDDGFSVATSTLVDDAFFVLQNAQQRAVATGDVQAACATLNQVNSVIQFELKESLIRNLLESQGIYSAYIENPDHLMNGSWYVMLQDHFTRCKQQFPESLASRYSFIHCLNNIEECLNFLSKFKEEISNGFKSEFNRDGKNDLLVESTLESLDSVLHEFETLLDTACNYSLNILKLHLTEPLNRFGEIDFNLDEESYTSYLAENPFVEELIGVLKAVFSHFSTFYSPLTRSKCIDSLIERICKYMETSILDKRFTIYGAVYLDGAVRSLQQVCTSYDPQTRRQFSTLLLVADVLNCGSAEDLSQFEGESSRQLIDSYFALRTDVAPNAIASP